MSQITFISLVLLLNTLFGEQGAEAATYYVSTTGGDIAGNGSISAPWQTIPKGIRSLHAGDTLYIRGGTYTLTNTYGVTASDTFGCIPSCPTSWDTATSVRNYPGESVVVNGGFGINMDQDIATGGVAYLIVEGDSRSRFIFDTVGFRVNSAVHHVRLSTLTIRNAIDDGIKGGTTCGPANTPAGYPNNIEILNNEIRHNGNSSAGPIHEHGIYPSCGNAWLVDQNWLVDNFASGVQFYSGTPGYHLNHTISRNICEGRYGPTGTVACIYIGQGTGHKIINNVVIRQGPTNPILVGIQVGDNAPGALVANNTVYDTDWGVHASYATNPIFTNNILFARSKMLYNQSSSGVSPSYNLCKSTDAQAGCSIVTPTPGFTNVAAQDFSLAAGSVAIDAGTTIASVTDDLRRVTRPQQNGYDIGAYEVVSGSGAAPGPPQNLSIK